MENKNNNGFLTGILIGLVIAVIVVGSLFATNTITLKQNNTNKQVNENTVNNTKTTNKTINDIKGTYIAEFNDLKADDESFKKATITLNLYENGVFTYVFSQYAPLGTMGNYIIDGDKIILTNWFNSGSSVGLTVTKGTKTLTINSNGSITDNNINNSILVDNEITTANLVKGTSQEQVDLSNRLAAACFNPVDGSCGRSIAEPAM